MKIAELININTFVTILLQVIQEKDIDCLELYIFLTKLKLRIEETKEFKLNSKLIEKLSPKILKDLGHDQTKVDPVYERNMEKKVFIMLLNVPEYSKFLEEKIEMEIKPFVLKTKQIKKVIKDIPFALIKANIISLQ